MFDSELLKQRFRRVLTEAVTAHNRAMVLLNRSHYIRDYYWGESSAKSSEFFTYASWEREFRGASETAIESLVERN